MISRKLISSLLNQTGNCNVKISVRFNSSEPLKTCLYDFHVASGGKMVDFAGLLMMLMFDTDNVFSAHVLTHQASWCRSSTLTREPWPVTSTRGIKWNRWIIECKDTLQDKLLLVWCVSHAADQGLGPGQSGLHGESHNSGCGQDGRKHGVADHLHKWERWKAILYK